MEPQAHSLCCCNSYAIIFATENKWLEGNAQLIDVKAKNNNRHFHRPQWLIFLAAFKQWHRVEVDRLPLNAAWMRLLNKQCIGYDFRATLLVRMQIILLDFGYNNSMHNNSTCNKYLYWHEFSRQLCACAPCTLPILLHVHIVSVNFIVLLLHSLAFDRISSALISRIENCFAAAGLCSTAYPLESPISVWVVNATHTHTHEFQFDYNECGK